MVKSSTNDKFQKSHFFRHPMRKLQKWETFKNGDLIYILRPISKMRNLVRYNLGRDAGADQGGGRRGPLCIFTLYERTILNQFMSLPPPLEKSCIRPCRDARSFIIPPTDGGQTWRSSKGSHIEETRKKIDYLGVEGVKSDISRFSMNSKTFFYTRILISVPYLLVYEK